MTRSRWLLLAAAVATSAVGCAHCDTCDQMPAPCAGGDCGVMAPAGTILAAPMAVGAPTTLMMAAPPVVTSGPRAAPSGPGPATGTNRAGDRAVGRSYIGSRALPLPNGGATPFSPPSPVSPAGPLPRGDPGRGEAVGVSRTASGARDARNPSMSSVPLRGLLGLQWGRAPTRRSWGSPRPGPRPRRPERANPMSSIEARIPARSRWPRLLARSPGGSRRDDAGDEPADRPPGDGPSPTASGSAG